ncbi:MAG: hypothetical protein KA791_07875 [Flavobacteriales bacterium]|nr:hypothetical protein [Flavobacteriales bacterium]
MYRNTALAFSLCSLAYTGQAQSYGLLVGGYHTDLRAAGEVFAPGTGLNTGFFMPFYVNDRLVIRAEAGLVGYRVRHAYADSTGTESRHEGSLTALGRFYLSKKVSLSLGIQGIYLLRAAEPIMVEGSPCVLRRTDLCLMLGAAYRWTDRWETGLRYGQGLLPGAELNYYATAHRRYLHVALSYLLHTAAIKFAARRQWRSDLALAHRY